MKLFILLVFSLIVVTSFTGQADHFPKAKEIEKGFVQISERISVGKYEVSNAEYKRFMAFLKGTKQEELYIKCLPDTTQPFKKSDEEYLKKHYYSHPSFETYPVVALSYDASNEYCKWLTVQYNADPDRKFKKVVFRLPTEGEWTTAARGGTKNKMYPWNNYYLRGKDGRFLCNFRHVGDQAIYYDSTTKTYKVKDDLISDITTLPLSAVNDFPPSPEGLYNLSGNAAEMVAENGLAKGGSYMDPGYDVTIDSKKYYTSPSTQIGFRVLMEILEK